LCAFLVLTDNNYAQHSDFSHFGKNFAGSGASVIGFEESTISMQYKDIRPDFPSNEVSYLFAGSHYFKQLKIGLGGYIFRESVANRSIRTTSSALQMNYTIRFRSGLNMRFGIDLHLLTKRLDFSSFVFGDQITEGADEFVILPTTSVVPTHESVAKLNAATSVIFYRRRYYFGLNVYNLLQPEIEFYNMSERTPLLFQIIAGGDFKRIRNKDELKSGYDFDVRYSYQRGFHTCLFKAAYEKNRIRAGLGYKTARIYQFNDSKSLILYAGYQVRNLKIGYSYDVSLNRFLNSHEIMLMFVFERKE